MLKRTTQCGSIMPCYGYAVPVLCLCWAGLCAPGDQVVHLLSHVGRRRRRAAKLGAVAAVHQIHCQAQRGSNGCGQHVRAKEELGRERCKRARQPEQQESSSSGAPEPVRAQQTRSIKSQLQLRVHTTKHGDAQAALSCAHNLLSDAAALCCTPQLTDGRRATDRHGPDGGPCRPWPIDGQPLCLQRQLALLQQLREWRAGGGQGRAAWSVALAGGGGGSASRVARGPAAAPIPLHCTARCN